MNIVINVYMQELYLVLHIYFRDALFVTITDNANLGGNRDIR